MEGSGHTQVFSARLPKRQGFSAAPTNLSSLSHGFWLRFGLPYLRAARETARLHFNAFFLSRELAAPRLCEDGCAILSGGDLAITLTVGSSW